MGDTRPGLFCTVRPLLERARIPVSNLYNRER